MERRNLLKHKSRENTNTCFVAVLLFTVYLQVLLVIKRRPCIFPNQHKKYKIPYQCTVGSTRYGLWVRSNHFDSGWYVLLHRTWPYCRKCLPTQSFCLKRQWYEKSVFFSILRPVLRSRQCLNKNILVPVPAINIGNDRGYFKSSIVQKKWAL